MPVTVTFAGSGDAFGRGGRYQACVHLRAPGAPPVLLDCGATSLAALKHASLDPGEISAVFLSHLHGDHFGGLPFLILDGQFSRRTEPLAIVGPPGTAVRLTEAMECLFPGSAAVSRRFDVEVIELSPGSVRTAGGVTVRAWQADHPSGATAALLRLDLAGKTIAYTGDTAWTDAILSAAAGADLLIAEAYYWEKDVPYHLRHADLDAHRDRLTARRVVLTHMSADMLSRVPESRFETARDGLVLSLLASVPQEDAGPAPPQQDERGRADQPGDGEQQGAQPVGTVPIPPAASAPRRRRTTTRPRGAPVVA